MWPDCVVVPPPSFDQHLGFLQRVEDLAIEQLVPQLSIEALVVAVLPRTAGLDVEGLYVDPAEPIPDRFRRELAAVVGPDMIRSPASDKELGQNLQHVV